jgi:hypothetical protein
MKKLLSIMAISAVAASAFAQGLVAFQNQTGTVKQWTSAADSTLMSVPKAAGMVELFAAPTTAAAPAVLFSPTTGGVTEKYSSLAAFLNASPGWASVAAGSSINLAPGLFSAGGLTIANIAQAASAQYFVIGWTGTAATLDAAIAGGAQSGMSGVATTATADPGSTPPGTPVNLKSTFAGVTLAPVIVPEPATFALAGLGLAALLAFRRRS